MCFFLSVLQICSIKILIYVLINISKNILLALMLNHFFVQCFCLSLQRDLPTLFLVFFFPVLLYGFLFLWVFCLFVCLFVYLLLFLNEISSIQIQHLPSDSLLACTWSYLAVILPSQTQCWEHIVCQISNV